MSALLARIDLWWTRIEVALAVTVGTVLVASLLFWVSIKGLAAVTTWDNVAGLIFRIAVTSLLCGLAAWGLSRKRSERFRATVTTVTVILAAPLGLLWVRVGVSHFSNLQGWLQDGSTFTLFGGVRGLGTRLTLWLALLGASLATATGRHVSIDVVTRALGDKLRAPLLALGGIVSAFVCLCAAWGFFDFIALDSFGAHRDDSAQQKLSAVSAGMSRHAFLFRRQLALDMHVAPSVLAGTEWSHALPVSEWNEWLAAGSWSSYFEKVPESEPADSERTMTPLVPSPGESPRGVLIKTFNLIIPFGLLMIALRFLLWVLRGCPVEGAHGTAPAAVTPVEGAA